MSTHVGFGSGIQHHAIHLHAVLTTGIWKEVGE